MPERQIAELVRKFKAQKAKDMPCKDGWNFHVYCLGADRCSICGAHR